MTQLQAIRIFCSEVIGTKIVISRYHMSSNWGMILLEKTPRLCVPRDLNYKEEEEDLLFYDNFIMRCEIAKNFSSTTLSILHELGHWETKDIINWEKDAKERDCAKTMKEYLNISSEYTATQWAIEWLQDEEHQKIAKEFEQEYFS